MTLNPSQKIPPDLRVLNNDIKSDIFSTLNCVQIGKIESVKDSEQTVEISLQIKRLSSDDTSTEYPVLVDCPYFILQGGDSYIDMPIKKGDYCLVLFNDRNIDTWWATANVAVPATSRKHSLSDGFALVGINPKTSSRVMQGQTLGLRGGSKKINIDNNVEKFDKLFSDLIDAVIAIKTFGSPPSHTLTPDTISAFNALKTRASNLLGGS
jgi:hypothetical protein